MTRNKIALLFFLLLGTYSLCAQTITGTVTGAAEEKLSNVNITVRNAETPQLISEFSISGNDGSFSITLRSKFENIILEATKMGFETRSFQLKSADIGDRYHLDIVLTEQAIVMEEVVISQRPKIEVAGDTVNYRASAFLDGSERKVEDLLKKIPGIQIDDQGYIKYKGRNVEKVLLDGDDLFDQNYTTGTQNMAVGIIDEVQAIEKFVENPLLAGIEDSDKVALNLKLKDGKTALSGEGTVGYGVEDRYYADINGLAVSKSNKNFSVVNYNNVGENKSPYNYFSFFPSPEESKNQPMFAPKLIPEIVSASAVGESRATINDNWYGGINNLYKISKSLNARVMLAYYDDKLSFIKSDRSDYIFDDDQQLTTTQEETVVKLPRQYDGNVKLTWNASKVSQLEITSKWNAESIRTMADLFTNDQNSLDSRLQSVRFFTKQDLLYTEKLSKTHSFQLQGIFSHVRSDQDLRLRPGLDLDTGNIIAGTSNRQQSVFHKNYLELGGTLLGVRKADKYHVKARTKYWQNKLRSDLYEAGDLLNSGYRNDLDYDLVETSAEAVYNFKFGKFTLKPMLQIKNYSWNRKEPLQAIDSRESEWLAAPSLLVSYKLDPLTRLYATYSYDRTPPRENNLYSGFVLSSSRTLVSNMPSTPFSKTTNATLGYELNDIYNQFVINASLNYFRQQNNFYANSTVTQNLTTVSYFFLPESNDTYTASASVEKYIPSIRSTIKLNGNFVSYRYINVVNGSDLRNNRSDIAYVDLFGKTALDIPLNFENTLRVQNSTSSSDNYDGDFTNTTIINSFKTLVKYNDNWFGVLIADYFLPSAQNTGDYYFLDAMLRYRIPGKGWEFNLTAKNITNNKYFKEVLVSDFYRSASSLNLNRAYLLLTAGFQF